MRWPIHLVSFLTFAAALVAGIAYRWRGGENGITWTMLMVWVVPSVIFFGWLLARAVYFGGVSPLTDWIVWIANILQWQSGLVVFIIFLEKLRRV